MAPVYAEGGRGRPRAFAVAEAGRSLQEMHRVLRNFPGELPYLVSPLAEIPRLLHRIELQNPLRTL
jgi:hypothetical protein